MLYKTIVLELLQSRPQLHEQLRRQRMLLPAMEHYARELKEMHEAFKQRLSETMPEISDSQRASQALELALSEFEGRLPSDSSSEDGSPLVLDQLLSLLRAETHNG